MKTEKIKVFLSDPQVLFREGIHFTLSGEEDFEVTGETTNNEAAFVAIEANPPNVSILNMESGKLNGPDATRRIKRNFSSVSMILIMDNENEEQLFAAIKCGANACLTKDTDPEYLVNIIREIAQGSKPIVETLLIPGLASRAAAEFEALSALSENINKLLARPSLKEIEILNLIAAGNGIEQVAARLSSSEEDIRHQLALIVNKLVANDQARTVIEATQHSFPSLIPNSVLGNGSAIDYITREEFNEFKDSLMQRLKSFIGELA
ncbi:response regulator [Chloroflexota bacterium]